jgi:hypothetical protein
MSIKSKDKIQIIIREWKDISISNEFRGFVYNSKLTALSQYFDICYFKSIEKNKEEIVQNIQKKFLEISKGLLFNNQKI